MTQLRPPQKSPRGSTITCKSWHQEAALRLLLNSLDVEIAARPDDLIICGNKKAVRDWDALQSIVADVRELPDDQTLFIQSGVPDAIYRTEAGAPRLLLVNPPPGDGAFDPLQFRRSGNLNRFSEACAASWLYVGNQAALQASYEILAFTAHANFGGTLAGKLIVSCGMDAVGGGQPLAATLHGAAALGIDPDPERVKRCVKGGYCEAMVNDLDEALRMLKNSVRKHEPASVGLVGECRDVLSELARRGIVPDILFPNLFERSAGQREARAMMDLQNLGSLPLDGETFIPGASIRETSEPLICVALSGDAADLTRIDTLLGQLFPSNRSLQHWIAIARKHVRIQGLPSRVVWLSPAERLQFTHAVNDAVRRQEFAAPLVLGGIFSRAFGPPVDDSAPHTSELLGHSGPAPVKIRDGRSSEGGLSELGFVAGLQRLAAGLSLAGVESLGGDKQGSRRLGCALVADGTPGMTARIDLVLGACK